MSLILHQLIHSLSKSEKRYFRREVEQNLRKEKSHYGTLFDLILSLPNYDAQTLKKKTAALPFSDTLAETKYLLYKLLLKILRQFHKKISVDVEVRNQLHEVEILFARGLLNQCVLVLKKARKKAAQFERFNLILEIIGQEENLVTRGAIPFRNAGFLMAERQEVLAKMQNLHDYQKLFQEVQGIASSTGYVRGGEVRTQLEDLLKSSLLTDPAAALSLRALNQYYEIRTFAFRLFMDFDTVYRDGQVWMPLLTANPQLIRENPTRYILALRLMIYASCWKKKVPEAIGFLYRMRDLEGKYPEVGNFWFANYSLMRLNMLLFFGEFDQAVKWVEEIQAKIGSFEGQLPPQFGTMLTFNMAHAYFGTGEPSQVVRLLNGMFSGKHGTATDQMQSASRILYLIAHFELGNELLLPYAVRSTYRFLLRRKRLFRYEKILLDFLQKTARIASRNELGPLFQDLYDDLYPLKKDPQEAIALENIAILPWLKSLIEGIPHSQAVKEDRGVVLGEI